MDEGKPDWADELAKEVLAETLVVLGSTSSAETRRLLAMRFRLVKEQGFGEGLDTAAAILKSGPPGSPRGVPHPVVAAADELENLEGEP